MSIFQKSSGVWTLIQTMRPNVSGVWQPPKEVRARISGSWIHVGHDPNYLFTWGRNDYYGQLGDGTTINKSSPVKIGTSTWNFIAAGKHFTMGILSNNRLYTWGKNNKGQLGDGTTTDRTTPTLIGSTTWRIVEGGYETAAGITQTYQLFTWGSNNGSALGQGTTVAYSATPARVGSSTWKAVSAWNHMLAIRSDNKLYGWGFDSTGQVTGTNTGTISTPYAIGTCTWKAISAGGNHSLGIRADDKLFAWGGDGYGQCGQGSTTSIRAMTQVGTSTWKAIAAGGYFSLAIRADNKVYAWGMNTTRQCGIGMVTDPVLTLTQISTSNMSSTDVPAKISASGGGSYSTYGHAALLTTSGFLFTWGCSIYGQMGDGQALTQSRPTKTVRRYSFKMVSCGGEHTAAITR